MKSKDDKCQSTIGSKMLYSKTTLTFQSFFILLVCTFSLRLITSSASSSSSSFWNRILKPKTTIRDQEDDISSLSTSVQSIAQLNGTNRSHQDIDERGTIHGIETSDPIVDNITRVTSNLTPNKDGDATEEAYEILLREAVDNELDVQKSSPSLLETVRYSQGMPDDPVHTFINQDLESENDNFSALNSTNDTSISSRTNDNETSNDEDIDDVGWMVFDTTSKRRQYNERKSQLFDRISIMSSTFMRREIDASMLPTKRLQQLRSKIMQLSLLQQKDGEPIQMSEDELNAVTPQSDLSLPGRYFHIVTTAALPWFTGTAVNPLLRAAYLHRRTKEINTNYEQPTESEHVHYHQEKRSFVTLVIPWLELPEDHSELYNRVFESMSDQEDYIRSWLRNEAMMPDVADELEIIFYPARYHSGLRSIFAMGDIMDVIKTANRDVCILEEPEHCNCKFIIQSYDYKNKSGLSQPLLNTNRVPSSRKRMDEAVQLRCGDRAYE